jgi:hypothetical protein
MPMGQSAAVNAIQEAESAGFDITLVEENLRCSPEQRAIQHQQALSLALELERAGKEHRERAQQPASTADKDLLAAKELRAILEARQR